MTVPSPYESLAGCVWLPRILAKARLLLAGKLPPEYEARFCHPTGIDGRFLDWFDLNREDVLAYAGESDDAVAAWFVESAGAARITAWNETAVNLGRAGYPMAERLPLAKTTTYAHLDAESIDNVFDLIVLDESGPS